MNYALENILKNDVKNVVKILTDGEDNETEDKFKALLANWCDIMEEHNIQASYYFKLIDEIKLLPELEELAERECMSIGGIEEWTAPKYTISGSPMIPLDVNQTSISLNFVPISENKLTSNATIHISSEDNILLDINQDIQVSATTQDLPINIKWKSTQSELNKLLPSSSEMTIKLTAKVVDGTDQLELNENNTLELTVRNGRVKYMKIAFK